MLYLEPCSCLLCLPYLPARRLLKVASLGLAGRLAGLLSGCTSTTDSASTHSSSDSAYTTPADDFS